MQIPQNFTIVLAMCASRQWNDPWSSAVFLTPKGLTLIEHIEVHLGTKSAQRPDGAAIELPLTRYEMIEDFESMLTGGHPNSLGRTLEVVNAVL